VPRGFVNTLDERHQWVGRRVSWNQARPRYTRVAMCWIFLILKRISLSIDVFIYLYYPSSGTGYIISISGDLSVGLLIRIHIFD